MFVSHVCLHVCTLSCVRTDAVHRLPWRGVVVYATLRPTYVSRVNCMKLCTRATECGMTARRPEASRARRTVRSISEPSQCVDARVQLRVKIARKCLDSRALARLVALHLSLIHISEPTRPY